MQHELPKELSQESNVPMNSNQILKVIKEAYGLSMFVESLLW